MKFDYLKQPNFLHPTKPWVSRPLIPVALLHNNKSIKVYALVDSGADMSLFHVSLARELGIEVANGRKEKFLGISEEAGIDVYVHTVGLQVIGNSEPIEIEIGFTESKNIGAILGQAGFFDHYHIKFERNKERFEIVSVP